MFGAGFSLACVVILTIWLSFGLPTIFFGPFERVYRESSAGNTPIVEPPTLDDRQKFLGSSGIYSGDFEHFNARTLASGEGLIIGAISANGQPVGGVEIRLALNGSAFSQWVKSNEDGKYRISVPYGDYRVDGYELNMNSAHQHLPGKIQEPIFRNTTRTFSVGPGKTGEGLHLDFVDSVIVLEPIGDVSLNDAIIARWKPYPGAVSYVVQVYEHENQNDISWSGTLFNWRKRPRVSETFIDLKEHRAELKAGYFYSLAVSAEDDRGKTISQTPMSQREQQFKVIN